MLVLWQKGEADGQLIARLPYQLFCLAYNANEGRCAVGTMQGSIYEFDVEKRQLLRQWLAHPSSVFDLQYDSSGKLYSIGKEGTLSRWGNAVLQPEASINLSYKSLRCFAFQGQSIFVGGTEGIIWELDSASLQIIKTLKISDTTVFGLVADDESLYCVGKDAHLSVWKDSTRIENLPAHWYSIHALSVSPDLHYLATGSMDKSIKIWTKTPLKLAKVIDYDRHGAHKSSVNKIAWLDENHFVSCSDDRMVLLFKIE